MNGRITYEWAQLMIEELYRLGVKHVVLSPGSRCTPLTVAVAQYSRMESTVHVDERGAAFYALGMARATNVPTALVCTSGTAGANYLPAVIEASQECVPLIILTADRPPELRDTAANQTIDQVKLFGDYVRWAFDMPAPTLAIPLESVLTTVDQAVHAATSTPAGPVHLNCMFREPFLPDELPATPTFNWPHPVQPYTVRPPISRLPDIEMAVAMLRQARRPLLVVGALQTPAETEAVRALVAHLQWRTLVDVRSGLRLGCELPHVLPYFDAQLGDDAFCQALGHDALLQIGGRLISKKLTTFLAEHKALNRVVLNAHPFRDDPSHLGGVHLHGDIAAMCQAIHQCLPGCRAKIEALPEVTFPVGDDQEAAYVRRLTQLIPEGNGLFLAASLPIRHVQSWGDPAGNPVRVAANRGASGIDGTIASAVGFCAGLQKPTTLLIGDLAMLHDLNSLGLLATTGQPVCIVVLNNDGGHIFKRLPISSYDEVFEPYFLTPHGLTFADAAAMYKLSYQSVETLEAFSEAYQASCDKPSIIEVNLMNG